MAFDLVRRIDGIEQTRGERDGRLALVALDTLEQCKLITPQARHRIGLTRARA
jgi:hypothetical protein